MRRNTYIVLCLMSGVLMFAIIIAASIERKTVMGQSSTASPDGNWRLNLALVEYTTLFNSRKVLDADVVHQRNQDWNVKTSIPFEQADSETISNRDPDHPIIWSVDSSNVNYWVNKQLKDTIRIEASDERHVFQRDLFAMRVVFDSNRDGD